MEINQKQSSSFGLTKFLSNILHSARSSLFLILNQAEEKSIRRWTAVYYFMIFGLVTRFFLVPWNLKITSLLSIIVMSLMHLGITRKYVKFSFIQWAIWIINLILTISSHRNTRIKYGWTPLETFCQSSAVQVPITAFLVFSGGIPGIGMITTNLLYILYCAYSSPALDSPEESERLGQLLYGWVFQSIVGMVTLVHDGQAQQTLETALATAVSSNEAKTKFVTWLSHDLRTPLVGLFGFLDHLIEDEFGVTDISERRDILSKARQCADVINGLITNLLDFSMFDSRQFLLKPVVVNLFNSFHFLSTLFRPLAHAKNIDFRSSINITKPVFVMADWVRLQQIVSNLIANALKYSPRGSKVDLNFEVVPIAMPHENPNNLNNTNNVNNHANTNNNTNTTNTTNDAIQLIISVKDNGIGIPAKELDLVFDQFYQVTRNSQYGSGLGLFIVRELVKAMGGKVRCESEVGVGSTFIVSDLIFPIASSRPEEIIQRQINIPNGSNQTTLKHKNSSSSASSKTITAKVDKSLVGSMHDKEIHVLIAEDNTINQQILVRQLQKCGFKFTLVNNGEEAVEAWRERRQSLDVILMDLQMPILDGYDATKKIRESEHQLRVRSLIPIVALTATTHPTELQTALSIGMNEYLIKPADTRSIQETIMRVVHHKRTTSSMKAVEYASHGEMNTKEE